MPKRWLGLLNIEIGSYGRPVNNNHLVLLDLILLEARAASECPFQASGSVSYILGGLISCDLNCQRAFSLDFLLTLACMVGVFYILESNL